MTKAKQFGRCWVDQMEESAISSTAGWCYTVMTSFGPVYCYAALPSIARRMKVKDLRTIRKAQSELEAEGWIIWESGGVNKTPNRWRMVKPESRVAIKHTDKKCRGAKSTRVENATLPENRSVPEKLTSPSRQRKGLPAKSKSRSRAYDPKPRQAQQTGGQVVPIEGMLTQFMSNLRGKNANQV